MARQPVGADGEEYFAVRSVYSMLKYRRKVGDAAVVEYWEKNRDALPIPNGEGKDLSTRDLIDFQGGRNIKPLEVVRSFLRARFPTKDLEDALQDSLKTLAARFRLAMGLPDPSVLNVAERSSSTTQVRSEPGLAQVAETLLKNNNVDFAKQFAQRFDGQHEILRFASNAKGDEVQMVRARLEIWPDIGELPEFMISYRMTGDKVVQRVRGIVLATEGIVYLAGRDSNDHQLAVVAVNNDRVPAPRPFLHAFVLRHHRVKAHRMVASRCLIRTGIQVTETDIGTFSEDEVLAATPDIASEMANLLNFVDMKGRSTLSGVEHVGPSSSHTNQRRRVRRE